MMKRDHSVLRHAIAATILLTLPLSSALRADVPEGADWRPLFNGEDLTGWEVPPGNDGAWKAVDGVIDYDAKAGKNLWTKQSFGDFELYVEWRLKTYEEVYGDRMGDDGQPIPYKPDSGILVRGNPQVRRQAQVNIKAAAGGARGSGEIHPQCSDRALPEEVRKTYQVKTQAAKPLGEWNTMRVKVDGNRISVTLNGTPVIDRAELRDVPDEGPIALQHHGGWRRETNTYHPLSSLVQFRNVYVREIDK